MKPTASGKTSQGSKRSADKETKPPYDKADAQKKCKDGFDAGIKKASELLVTNKNDYIKMALDMAKHIQSLKPVFKTTDSTKNSLSLLFPLEFVDDKACRSPERFSGQHILGPIYGPESNIGIQKWCKPPTPSKPTSSSSHSQYPHNGQECPMMGPVFKWST